MTHERNGSDWGDDTKLFRWKRMPFLVEFIPGTAEIDTRSLRELSRLPEMVQQMTDVRLMRVEAFTHAWIHHDEPELLSNERAQRVADFLTDRGVAPSMFEIVSYGARPSYPMAGARSSTRRYQASRSSDGWVEMAVMCGRSSGTSELS